MRRSRETFLGICQGPIKGSIIQKHAQILRKVWGAHARDKIRRGRVCMRCRGSLPSHCCNFRCPSDPRRGERVGAGVQTQSTPARGTTWHILCPGEVGLPLSVGLLGVHRAVDQCSERRIILVDTSCEGHTCSSESKRDQSNVPEEGSYPRNE